MNKIKTLSAILLLTLTFSISSCSSDENYDDISDNAELNIKSPSSGDDKSEEDDPTNGG